jgi:hypothetical protein
MCWMISSYPWHCLMDYNIMWVFIPSIGHGSWHMWGILYGFINHIDVEYVMFILACIIVILQFDIKLWHILQMSMWNVRAFSHYIPRLNSITPNRGKVPWKSSPWGYNKQYNIFESWCAIVWRTWSQAQGSSLMKKMKSIDVSSKWGKRRGKKEVLKSKLKY